MEAGQCHKLELVAHRAEFALKAGDRSVVKILFPVERWRAVIGEQFSRINLVNGLREFSCLIEIRLRGFAPQQIGIRRIGQAASDGGLRSALNVVEAFRGALSGQEFAIARIDIAGDQIARCRRPYAP